MRIWAGDGVHLSADLVEERVAVRIDGIEIEVGAIGQVGEVRICAKPAEDCLEFMCSAVEVKGVGGAHDEVDAAFQVGFECGPVGFDDVGEIVVIVPVGRRRLDRRRRWRG